MNIFVACVRAGAGAGGLRPFATSPEVFVIGVRPHEGSRGRSGPGGRVIMTAFGICAGAGGEMQGKVGREEQ